MILGLKYYDDLGYLSKEIRMNNIDSLIPKYIQLSIEHRENIQNGNYKNANKAYRRLRTIYRKLEENKGLAIPFLQYLLKEENASVRSWAASHALGLNVLTNDAEKVLSEIVETDKTTMLGFSAEMTLSQWKKNGYLLF